MTMGMHCGVGVFQLVTRKYNISRGWLDRESKKESGLERKELKSFVRIWFEI